MKICIAPHLDDEVIGCYSIYDELDKILYWHDDYRVEAIAEDERYSKYTDSLFLDFITTMEGSTEEVTVYLPSQFDFHPLHKKVRYHVMGLLEDYNMHHINVMFYSIEMNVPWLEEEPNSKEKSELFQRLYPKENLKSDKYFLFKSIKPFDEKIWAVARTTFEGYHKWEDAPREVRFLSNLHRHIFHVEAKVLQTHDDRNVEYIMLKRKIDKYIRRHQFPNYYSCEMMARDIKRFLESQYEMPVEVSVFEDNENGAILK